MGAGTASYNINRKFTYTYNPTTIVLTCVGEGIGITSGSLSNLENFGTTRDGDLFTSQVTTPIVWLLQHGVLGLHYQDNSLLKCLLEALY